MGNSVRTAAHRCPTANASTGSRRGETPAQPPQWLATACIGDRGAATAPRGATFMRSNACRSSFAGVRRRSMGGLRRVSHAERSRVGPTARRGPRPDKDCTTGDANLPTRTKDGQGLLATLDQASWGSLLQRLCRRGTRVSYDAVHYQWAMFCETAGLVDASGAPATRHASYAILAGAN